MKLLNCRYSHQIFAVHSCSGSNGSECCFGFTWNHFLGKCICKCIVIFLNIILFNLQKNIQTTVVSFLLQPALLATLESIVNYHADIHRMDVCVSQRVTVWSHTVITSTVAKILKMV